MNNKLGVKIEVDVDLSVVRPFAGMTPSGMSDLQLISFERSRNTSTVAVGL